MKTITLVIADDHPLLLKGLGDFVKSKGYNVIKQAADGNVAWKSIVDLKPDIAILDIEMPYLSGINIARLIHQNKLNTKVILLSYQIEQGIIELGTSIGISGYILKEDALSEIEESISYAMKDEIYLSAQLKNKAAETAGESLSLIALLTPSEKKILKKIATDYTSKQIAETFNISERTVEKHRSNIIQKLNIARKQFSLLTWVHENKDLINNI